MKVLLFNPNSRWRASGARVSPCRAYPRAERDGHLGLGYLAASLDRDGVECEVLDADLLDLSLTEVVRRAAALRPSLVGVSLLHDTFPQALALITRLKAAIRAPVVAGGHLPTAGGAELLRLAPEIDFALQGEAEESLVALCRALERTPHALAGIHGLSFRDGDGSVRQTPRAPPPRLDALPLPRRPAAAQLFEVQDSAGQPRALRVLAGRGCSGRCHFCSIRAFYGSSGPRFRDEASVVAEIEELHGTTGARYFFFADDDFLGPAPGRLDRVRRLAARLRARRLDIRFTISSRLDHFSEEAFRTLRDVGLMHVGFGLENVSDDALRFFNKGHPASFLHRAVEGIVRLDLSASFFMILYHPLATLEQVFQNYELLRALGYLEPDGPPGKAFNLLVGTRLLVRRFTPMEAVLRRRGLHRGYLDSNPFIVSYAFADAEVEVFWRRLYDRARSRPEQTVPIFTELIERARYGRARASRSR